MILNNETLKSVFNKTAIQYWMIFLTAALLLFINKMNILPVIEDRDTVIQIQSMAILLTMACIPLSLKLYASKLKKIVEIDDQTSFLKAYTLNTLLRVIILGFAVVVDLITYCVTQDAKMLICTLIVLVATFFCYPSKKRIYMESLTESEHDELFSVEDSECES